MGRWARRGTAGRRPGPGGIRGGTMVTNADTLAEAELPPEVFEKMAALRGFLK